MYRQAPVGERCWPTNQQCVWGLRVAITLSTLLLADPTHASVLSLRSPRSTMLSRRPDSSNLILKWAILVGERAHTPEGRDRDERISGIVHSDCYDWLNPLCYLKKIGNDSHKAHPRWASQLVTSNIHVLKSVSKDHPGKPWWPFRKAKISADFKSNYPSSQLLLIGRLQLPVYILYLKFENTNQTKTLKEG